MDSKHLRRSSRTRPLERPVRIYEPTDDGLDEARTKRAHDVPRKAKGKEKLVEVNSDTLPSEDEEAYAYEEEYNFVLSSLLPPKLQARLARLSRQPTKKKEPRRITIGQKMKSDINYYEEVKKFKLTPSMRIDHSATQALGIADDVEWLLDTLRLRAFMETSRQDIYEEETRQFLASVTFTFPRLHNTLARDGIISFMIHGETYALTIPQMGTALGLEYQDGIDFGPETVGDFWHQVGNGNFISGRSKAATISHPAIRYVHKLLANNLFARTALNSMLGEELLVLKTAFDDFPRRVNYASLLAKRLVKMKHEAKTCTDDEASLSYGGVITKILEAAGVNLDSNTCIYKEIYLDLPLLGKMKILEGATTDPDRFGYRYHTPPNMIRTILLPSATMPHLRDKITRWDPPASEFLSLRSGDHLPFTIGKFIKKKAMETITSHHSTQASTSHETATSLLEEERARRIEAEQELAHQKALLAKMRRMIRRTSHHG